MGYMNCMSLLVSRDSSEGKKYRKLEMNVTESSMGIMGWESWNKLIEHPVPHFDCNLKFKKKKC